MTPESLKSCTRKTLADMAQSRGVGGWHSMRKEQLVAALLNISNSAKRKSTKRRSSSTKSVEASKSHNPSSGTRLKSRDLAAGRPAPSRPVKDSFVVLVRDPYWLQAHWELSRATVARAEAALGADWHRSQPMIRVLDVSDDETSNVIETCIEEIPIHGGARHWFISIDGQPRAYKLQIGYGVPQGRFHVLARSNVVTPPLPGSPRAFEDSMKDIAAQSDRVFSRSGGNGHHAGNTALRDLFSERLGVQVNDPAANFGVGVRSGEVAPPLDLNVEVELLIHGSSHPGSRVTVCDDPVELREDGTFSLRLSLQEGRQVLPTVSISPDGMQQRTTIVAIERNTKALEPQSLANE